MNLKESAQAFTPQQTLNISELKRVPLTIEVNEETHQDNEGKDFTGLYAVIEGQKYRIPYSVLAQIKMVVQEQPNVKFVKVTKTGTGMATKYLVMSLVE
jgi:hypothetical protein